MVELELDGQLRDVFRILYFGETLTLARCKEVLGSEVFDQLMELGLLAASERGRVSCGGLQLNVVAGLLVFAELPSIRHSIYFGTDSLGLARRHPPLPGVAAIDFCCGSGVQALTLARSGAHVIGVDINPLALSLARINASINKLSGQVSFSQGNLWEAIPENMMFDWVCANPPLLPTIKDLNYPLIGAGGEDGMDVTWRILRGLPLRLSPQGQALVLGVTFGDGVLPNCADPLREFLKENGMDAIFETIHTSPVGEGSEWVQCMAQTYSIHEKVEVEAATNAIMAQVRAQNAEKAIYYFLRLRRGSGRLKVIDLSTMNPGHLWRAN